MGLGQLSTGLMEGRLWLLRPCLEENVGKEKKLSCAFEIVGRSPRCGKLSKQGAYGPFLCLSREEGIFKGIIEAQSSSLQELAGGWMFLIFFSRPALGWVYALVPGNHRICLCILLGSFPLYSV